MSYPSDLFRAIFTPGAPPALLIATNVSFALLQLTLLVLLLATSSWHFVFLSILCLGVWGGINWFVREMEQLKKVDEQVVEIRRVMDELEKEQTQHSEDEDTTLLATGGTSTSTGMQVAPGHVADEVERRKSGKVAHHDDDDEEEDDDFEKVEKEDGYETEGRKAK